MATNDEELELKNPDGSLTFAGMTQVFMPFKNSSDYVKSRKAEYTDEDGEVDISALFRIVNRPRNGSIVTRYYTIEYINFIGARFFYIDPYDRSKRRWETLEDTRIMTGRNVEQGYFVWEVVTETWYQEHEEVMTQITKKIVETVGDVSAYKY